MSKNLTKVILKWLDLRSISIGEFATQYGKTLKAPYQIKYIKAGDKKLNFINWRDDDS